MADAMTERQRLGLSLRDPLPWRDLSMLVGTAEETGFDTVFFPEIGGGRRTPATIRGPGGGATLATSAGLGAGASQVRLGPGVVPVSNRRLPLLAMAAATAHERTGGRLVL